MQQRTIPLFITRVHKTPRVFNPSIYRAFAVALKVSPEEPPNRLKNQTVQRNKCMLSFLVSGAQIVATTSKIARKACQTLIGHLDACAVNPDDYLPRMPLNCD